MDTRPRVSRETRLLFATVLVAIVALWILARFRFPEQPPPANPVAPVLTQLAPTPAFSDLAAAVADVQPRALLPFVALQLRSTGAGHDDDKGNSAVAAFRVSDDIAVALLRRAQSAILGALAVDATVVNVDRATGLAAFKVPPAERPTLAYWSPARVDLPRYLLATSASPEGLSLRPVFVSSLVAEESVVWETTVWRVPADTDISAGTFVFTSTGTLAGLVVDHNDRLAVLPMTPLVAAAERLLQQRHGPPGWLGVDVQSLTPPLIAATGASGGLIVTWVDPAGPAAGSIQVADVLEAIEGADNRLTDESWEARTARLVPGDSLTIRVRRGTMTQPVRLTAIERPPSSSNLGLSLRRTAGGAEVLRVDPASASALAGINAGDIVTFAGGVTAPTPAQIARAYATAAGRPLVVGLTRGNAHLLVVVNAR